MAVDHSLAAIEEIACLAKDLITYSELNDYLLSSMKELYNFIKNH